MFIFIKDLRRGINRMTTGKSVLVKIDYIRGGMGRPTRNRKPPSVSIVLGSELSWVRPLLGPRGFYHKHRKFYVANCFEIYHFINGDVAFSTSHKKDL